MKTDSLDKITRANLVLGAAVTAVAGLLWGAHGMLAAGVGAALVLRELRWRSPASAAAPSVGSRPATAAAARGSRSPPACC